MINNFLHLVDRGVEGYTAPKTVEISGTTVRFRPHPTGLSWDRWRSILDTWLPRYDNVGWLDDLIFIKIEHDCINSNAVAEYSEDRKIYIELDPTVPSDLSKAIGSDKPEYILTHEIIHHAHIYHNGFDETHAPVQTDGIKRDVSYYAGNCVGEMIAEIGAGIVHGEDFPEYVHDQYEQYDGPREAYEIRDAC